MLQELPGGQGWWGRLSDPMRARLLSVLGVASVLLASWAQLLIPSKARLLRARVLIQSALLEPPKSCRVARYNMQLPAAVARAPGSKVQS